MPDARYMVGINPAADSDGSVESDCDCDFCLGYAAASALHTGRSGCLSVAAFDVDLQRVIAAWGTLPEPMRQAIMALVGAVIPRSEGLTALYPVSLFVPTQFENTLSALLS